MKELLLGKNPEQQLEKMSPQDVRSIGNHLVDDGVLSLIALSDNPESNVREVAMIISELQMGLMFDEASAGPRIQSSWRSSVSKAGLGHDEEDERGNRASGTRPLWQANDSQRWQEAIPDMPKHRRHWLTVRDFMEQKLRTAHLNKHFDVVEDLVEDWYGSPGGIIHAQGRQYKVKDMIEVYSTPEDGWEYRLNPDISDALIAAYYQRLNAPQLPPERSDWVELEDFLTLAGRAGKHPNRKKVRDCLNRLLGETEIEIDNKKYTPAELIGTYITKTGNPTFFIHPVLVAPLIKMLEWKGIVPELPADKQHWWPISTFIVTKLKSAQLKNRSQVARSTVAEWLADPLREFEIEGQKYHAEDLVGEFRAYRNKVSYYVNPIAGNVLRNECYKHIEVPLLPADKKHWLTIQGFIKTKAKREYTRERYQEIKAILAGWHQTGAPIKIGDVEHGAADIVGYYTGKQGSKAYYLNPVAAEHLMNILHWPRPIPDDGISRLSITAMADRLFKRYDRNHPRMVALKAVADELLKTPDEEIEVVVNGEVQKYPIRQVVGYHNIHGSWKKQEDGILYFADFMEDYLRQALDPDLFLSRRASATRMEQGDQYIPDDKAHFLSERKLATDAYDRNPQAWYADAVRDQMEKLRSQDMIEVPDNGQLVSHEAIILGKKRRIPMMYYVDPRLEEYFSNENLQPFVERHQRAHAFKEKAAPLLPNDRKRWWTPARVAYALGFFDREEIDVVTEILLQHHVEGSPYVQHYTNPKNHDDVQLYCDPEEAHVLISRAQVQERVAQSLARD